MTGHVGLQLGQQGLLQVHQVALGVDLLLLEGDDYRFVRLRVEVGLRPLLELLRRQLCFEGLLTRLSGLGGGGGLDEVLVGVGQQLLPVEVLLFDRALGFVVPLALQRGGLRLLRVLRLVVDQVRVVAAVRGLRLLF